MFEDINNKPKSMEFILMAVELQNKHRCNPAFILKSPPVALFSNGLCLQIPSDYALNFREVKCLQFVGKKKNITKKVIQNVLPHKIFPRNILAPKKRLTICRIAAKIRNAKCHYNELQINSVNLHFPSLTLKML